MNLRPANLKDRSDIERMYRDGSNYLKEQKVDQWQGEQRPNLKDFETWIQRKEIFVLEEEQPIATCLLMEEEPDYKNIYQGQWLSSGKNCYIIHRVALLASQRKKGYGLKLLQEIEKLAKRGEKESLRVDTHEDNIPMQSLLTKAGYQYCGIIYLEIEGKRLAYEKKL
ncbi:MAG: GNAT family N-acetyltransferase [Tissierellia bacterium]|nr:GNAT family N-acetyltransferase [Tissierellia bacterium]